MPSHRLMLRLAACAVALSAPMSQAQAKRRPAAGEVRARIQLAPSPASDRSNVHEPRGRSGDYDDPRFERGM